MVTVLFEIIFGFIFEVIFKSLFYALRQIWFGITGQDGKAEEALDRRRAAKVARRRNVERIRQQR